MSASCSAFLCPLGIILAWLLISFSLPPSLTFQEWGRRQESPRGCREMTIAVHILSHGALKLRERTWVMSRLSLLFRLFYFETHCITEKDLSSQMRPLLGGRISVLLLSGYKGCTTSITLKIMVNSGGNTPANIWFQLFQNLGFISQLSGLWLHCFISHLTFLTCKMEITGVHSW